ncbi:Tyrosine recombinase XerD [Varanus komodoensis]|nr:Tyrosine recombinase XerD [Varanus komodoensis]
MMLAVHLAGTDNVEADALSRQMSTTHKWELDRVVCNQLFQLRGQPDIDLFATRLNRLYGLFCSRVGLGLDSRGDALMIDWNNLFFYAFPPIPLLMKVVSKIVHDNATGILITPWSTSGPTVLSSDIQAILESALRPSTRKSYSAKWRRFSSFANAHSFSPESASIENILQFLFNLHRSGLKPSSIKVYTAAISHFRGSIQGSSVFSQPLIRCFLKGLQNLHPSVQPVMPT